MNQEHHGNDTDEEVFFYERDFYVLSNFSAFNVGWRGRTFQTAEHAYQWAKFCPVGSDEVANMIFYARSAHDAFKIAETFAHERNPSWDEIKVDTMEYILRAKAAQHEYVRRKLLSTGNRLLIEDSWRDSFWGWGPDRAGQNVLGKLWMKIRDSLR